MKKKFLLMTLCIALSISLLACSSEKQIQEPSIESPVIDSTTEPIDPSIQPSTEPFIEPTTIPSQSENVDKETDPAEPDPTVDITAPTESNAFVEFDVTFEKASGPIYAKSFVNVRTGPGTEYNKIGSMDLGDSAQLIAVGANGWSKILYNGQEAYAFSEYLTTKMPLAADPNHTHNYNDTRVVKPTCTSDGYTIHSCVCGKSYTDTATKKIEHAYEVSKIVEPTCTAKGYTVNKCKNCGATYNDKETDMVEHVYKTKVVKPTCSDVGYTLHKCDCGKSYKTDETVKIPHEYTDQTVDATCESDGYINHVCKNCAHSYQEENGQKAMGHDYSEKGKTVAATCDSEGHTVYKCTRCTKTQNKDKVAALGHDYSVQKKTVVATCTDDGYTSYQCSRCDKTTKKDQVAALGHDYVTETIAPTKDKEGYDLHTCSRCKDSYKDNYKDPVINYKEVNETVYATSDVNIRKGPSTNHEKIGSLSKGESITRIGIGDNGWSKVKYNNEVAYIHSDYITTTPPIMLDPEGWPKVYADGTCTITIYKEWYKNAYVYAAHIKFSDYKRFGTDCANGAYNNGRETTSHAAKRLGAIFAVNGCYSSPNLDYTVVRGGKIWNGSGRATFWCPAVYSFHNGKLLSAWDGSWGTPGISGGQIDDLVASGKVTDTFCFGPPSMFNGEIANNTDTSRAQRTFIGTNGNAGDIWVCVSDGRYNDGKSAGLTFKEAAEYLKEKGCTFCVHLDGGGSSTMYFNGKVLNAANGNQRSVVDFVYFK